jgi:hypothetical protein
VFVSNTVHDQVRDRLPFVFKDLGEQQVKNIAPRVRVYRVRDAAATKSPSAPAQPALPLPDKPSIAVLPFANMSGDPEQEYFADGMVEEIITALSRIRWLFVIARNSTLTCKGRPIDVKARRSRTRCALCPRRLGSQGGRPAAHHGTADRRAKRCTSVPDSKEFQVTPGTLDPRPVVRELDAAIRKDWDIILAGGHCFNFAATHLKGRPGGKYHVPIDFGAIGSGLSAGHCQEDGSSIIKLFERMAGVTIGDDD